MVNVTEITNWAVDLIDVHKTYRGRIHALRGAHVQVRAGEIFGLLGPNGAGKSTLVKIMMTVVRADRALGTVLGRPLGFRPKLARIGYLPESHAYPGYLTGAQLLDFYGALAKVPQKQRRANAERLIHRVGMKDWANVPIRKYSKGMLQRIGLAQALMNDPELVVLDEPTDGVDPIGRRDIRDLLLELKSQGATVFLNSHMLSELERVCDRVAILINGRVNRQGTLDQLTEHTIEYRIRVAGNLSEPRPSGRGCSEGRGRSDIQATLARLGARVKDGLITLPGRDTGKVNELIDALRSDGVLIESVTPRRFSLEEVFEEAIQQESRTPSAEDGRGER